MGRDKKDMWCSVPKCGRPVRVVASGMCYAHYQRQRRGTPLDAPMRRSARKNLGEKTHPLKSCKVGGCGRPKRSKGLCLTHRQRQMKDPGNWSGPIMPYLSMQRVGEFTVPEEVLEAIEAEAKARGVKPSVVKREALEEWYTRWKASQSTRYQREGDDGTEVLGPPPAEDDGVWRRAVAAAASDLPRRDMEERFGPGMASRAIAEAERMGSRTRGASAELPFGLPVR